MTSHQDWLDWKVRVTGVLKHRWCADRAATYRAEGPIAKGFRDFVDIVRPLDVKLADMYIELAKATEALHAHVIRRDENHAALR